METGARRNEEESQRVYDWPGGALRIVRRSPSSALELRPSGWRVTLEDEDLGVDECVPFGHGLALRVGKAFGIDGLEVELGVVDGRVECVGIRAAKGRALSAAALRLPLRRLVGELAPLVTVRVVRTESGDVVGETWDSVTMSTTSAGHPAIRGDDYAGMISEVEAARVEAPRQTLDEAFLGEVANVYREAEHLGISTQKAIQARWRTSGSNARRWVMLARRRGLLGEAPAQRRAGEKPTIEGGK